MSTNIYGLYYFDSSPIGKKRYFYVGRSIDVIRRLKEHNYAKKEGHEDKYDFIREIESQGIDWDVDVLKEIPDGEYPPDNERWYVIKLIREGHDLTNMRYGSESRLKELVEQVAATQIRSVSDVAKDRLFRKYQHSKKLKRRVLKEILKEEGIRDVRSDNLLPRVLHRKLLSQGVKSIQAGLTISEIYSICRGERKLKRLKHLLPNSSSPKNGS
jgi:hypothetical protein